MTESQGFYPVAEIAAVLNLQRRRVQQLAAAGIIPRAERGRYNLAESIAGYVRYLQDQIERSAPSSLDQHRLSLIEERYRKLKFENDQREAALIRREDAEIVMAMIVDTFFDSAKALYARKLLDEFVGMTEPAVVRHRLKEAVRTMRHDASDRLVALYEQGTGKKYPY